MWFCFIRGEHGTEYNQMTSEGAGGTAKEARRYFRVFFLKEKDDGRRPDDIQMRGDKFSFPLLRMLVTSPRGRKNAVVKALNIHLLVTLKDTQHSSSSYRANTDTYLRKRFLPIKRLARNTPSLPLLRHCLHY